MVYAGVEIVPVAHLMRLMKFKLLQGERRWILKNLKSGTILI